MSAALQHLGGVLRELTWSIHLHCGVRKGHAAENLVLLRKLTLNHLRADQTIKDTIRAARCQPTLETLLKLISPESGSPGRNRA